MTEQEYMDVYHQASLRAAIHCLHEVVPLDDDKIFENLKDARAALARISIALSKRIELNSSEEE